MTSEKPERTPEEWWALFTDLDSVAREFGIDTASDAQQAYAFSEIAFAMVKTRAGRDRIAGEIMKLSPIQQAVCVEAAIGTDVPLEKFAKYGIASEDERLRAACTDYCFHETFKGLFCLLAETLSDSSPYVRRIAALRFLKFTREMVKRSEQVITRVISDESEIVSSSLDDEVGALPLAEWQLLRRWFAEENGEE